MLLSMVSFLMIDTSSFYQYLSSSSDIYEGIPQYNCTGSWMYGGYNQYGRGDTLNHTFTLPEHQKVRISMTIMLGDSWDYQDNQLYIYVDGTLIAQLWKNPWHDQYLCGNPTYPEKWVPFTWEGAHTNSQLQFYMRNTLDEDPTNEWLGFTDFKIYYDDYCYRLYSECNYQGTEYKMCANNPAEDQQQFLNPIQSFLIPLGKVLQLQDPNFQGGSLITYNTSQTCIGPYNFPKKTPRRDP